ncbi:MAG TPA: hypothetical protein PLS20_01190, partial [Ruminococcus flavefaciens]|nr:hypothetical protein [Ruminococcus flavefaciens]
GAFRNIDNAKKSCASGYSVFDKDGDVVHSNGKSYAKGTAVTLKDTTLYASSTAKTGIKKSGTFYLYDGKVVNGRLRITNSPKNCGNTPIGKYVTGWIDKNSI